MRPYARLMILALLLLTGILTACNAAGDTPPPPVVDPDSVDISTIELPKDFNDENLIGDTLSLRYPEDWHRGGNVETILLATSRELVFTDEAAAIPSGDAGASIVAFRKDMAQTMVDGDLTPSSLLETFTGTLRSETASFSEPQMFTLGGNPAARASGSDASMDGLIMVMETDDAYILLIGSTARGELAQFEPTMRAILSSVTYTINPDTVIGDENSDPDSTTD